MKNYIKYFSALLLFGSNGIAASHIHMSSYRIVLMRTMLGSALLILIFFLSKSKPVFYRRKRQFAFLLLSGAAMGASWMFIYEAYYQIGVSTATLAYACGPVIVMLLSPILFGERFTAPKILGFITVLCGSVLINGKTAVSGGNTWGIFCGLMSAVMYAFMIILNKKAADITGLENSMFQIFSAFVTVAVFSALKHDFSIHIGHSDIIPMLTLALINTGIGCYLYFSSIGRLPVQTAAVCSYIEPLSAVIFSALFLHEAMGVCRIAGAALIIGGAAAVELSAVKPKHTE